MLFRDGFQYGFTSGLQFLNAIAGGDEHVPEFREVRFVAERAVPATNLGVIAGERENLVGGGNIASDCATRTGVDVGIHAVEKNRRPSELRWPLEMNVYVRVRMRGSKVF